MYTENELLLWELKLSYSASKVYKDELNSAGGLKRLILINKKITPLQKFIPALSVKIKVEDEVKSESPKDFEKKYVKPYLGNSIAARLNRYLTPQYKQYAGLWRYYQELVAYAEVQEKIQPISVSQPPQLPLKPYFLSQPLFAAIAQQYEEDRLKLVQAYNPTSRLSFTACKSLQEQLKATREKWREEIKKNFSKGSRQTEELDKLFAKHEEKLTNEINKQLSLYIEQAKNNLSPKGEVTRDKNWDSPLDYSKVKQTLADYIKKNDTWSTRFFGGVNRNHINSAKFFLAELSNKAYSATQKNILLQALLESGAGDMGIITSLKEDLIQHMNNEGKLYIDKENKDRSRFSISVSQINEEIIKHIESFSTKSEPIPNLPNKIWQPYYDLMQCEPLESPGAKQSVK